MLAELVPALSGFGSARAQAAEADYADAERDEHWSRPATRITGGVPTEDLDQHRPFRCRVSAATGGRSAQTMNLRRPRVIRSADQVIG